MKYFYSIILNSFFLCSFCSNGFSQDLKTIQEALEGEIVQLKIDMPASALGIDLNINTSPPLDQEVYNNRINNFGVSIFKEDKISITKIELLDSSNIVIHLGAGGYDYNEATQYNEKKTDIIISDQENILTQRIAIETDNSKLAQLKKDLNKLKRSRKSKQAQINTRAKEARIKQKEKELAKSNTSGSRININFAHNVAPADLDLNNITNIISQYLVLADSNNAQSSELIIKSSTKEN